MSSNQQGSEMKYVLRVKNINCKGCEKKIQKRLEGVPGVRDISIDAENSEVTVTGNNVDSSKLIEELRKARKLAEPIVNNGASSSDAQQPRPNQNQIGGREDDEAEKLAYKKRRKVGGMMKKFIGRLRRSASIKGRSGTGSSNNNVSVVEGNVNNASHEIEETEESESDEYLPLARPSRSSQQGSDNGHQMGRMGQEGQRGQGGNTGHGGEGQRGQGCSMGRYGGWNDYPMGDQMGYNRGYMGCCRGYDQGCMGNYQPNMGRGYMPLQEENNPYPNFSEENPNGCTIA